MGRHAKQLLTLIFIVLVSVSCLFQISNGDDDLINNYYRDEYGYDLGNSYPSYFNPIEFVKFDNNSVRIEKPFSEYFKKKFYRRLDAVVAVKRINVLNYGARGDGITDDTKAFQSAWKEACSSSSNVNFLVPQNKKYLLKPLRFQGPCKSHITMEIAGTLVASENRSDYSTDGRHWLLVENVQNLLVEGGGTINGNGNIWWKNSCKIDKTKPCKSAPTAMTFYNCQNLVVKKLNVQNAQQIHISFEKCRNVAASDLVVKAPGNSPNTDGIHITATENIQISSSTIGTGDDCISIVSGSKKVRATDITCGPGHGISIGSLGAGNSEEYVSDVAVNRAKLSGTTNGVRIKTWQGGSGSASKLKFQNIQMQNVTNPIIIDQNYCDQDEPCKEQGSAVQVRNIVYKNIKGTSASNVAIDFECSKSHPCQGIVLENVNMVGVNGAKSEAVCKNVNLMNQGTVSPHCP